LAIAKIYVEYHGFEQAANGFWIQEQEGIGKNQKNSRTTITVESQEDSKQIYHEKSS
jgi:hypothetical protein